MVKALDIQDSFSGRYEDDLEEAPDVFEDLAEMCEVNPKQKRKEMIAMIKGMQRNLF